MLCYFKCNLEESAKNVLIQNPFLSGEPLNFSGIGLYKSRVELMKLNETSVWHIKKKNKPDRINQPTIYNVQYSYSM